MDLYGETEQPMWLKAWIWEVIPTWQEGLKFGERFLIDQNDRQVGGMGCVGASWKRMNCPEI